MKLETQDCKRIAQAFAELKQSQIFSNPALNARHEQIQQKLTDLETFFNHLSEMVETNETALLGRSVRMPFTGSGFAQNYADGSIRGDLSSLARGRTVTLAGGAGYALAASGSSWQSGPFYAGCRLSALEAEVQGNASIRLMKNRRFNPDIQLEAAAGARLAAGSIQAGVQSENFGLEAAASGEVGAVYGQAKASFSVDEQVLSAQVGAAAARGECSLSFQLADLKVTIGVSGSLGSVEAGFDYSSTPGSWQMGVNGALFAGGGIRIQVDY